MTELEHIEGTYACLLPDKESRRLIKEFTDQFEFPQPVYEKSHHCTLIYSKLPCPKIIDIPVKFPIIARPLGLEELDPGLVVLTLTCPGAHDIFNIIRKDYNATHDYPDYKPHITICKNRGDKSFTHVQIPNFDIRFIEYHVSPLQLERIRP